MPIFVHGEPKDKLTILHFITVIDLDITQEQLYRAMVENDCMSYFAFQNAFVELEEDGLIAAIPRSFGQGYRVSERGKKTLQMFVESLPFSLRERLRVYADGQREAMRRETQLVTSMDALQSGGYMVHLMAQEQDFVVLDVAMNVASREMAQRIRGNWDAESEGVYAYLIEHLLHKKNAEDGQPE